MMPRRMPKKDEMDDQQMENKEHTNDKNEIIKLIQKFKVDLVVLGANNLEARRLFETF